MDIKILHSWLSEYLETNATPEQIGKALALSGPSVERVYPIGEDWLYEIEVTTNRVDMMSIIGIAREAAVILPNFGYQTKFNPPKLENNLGINDQIKLNIQTDPRLTNRVMAVIMDVEIGKSPENISTRLENTDIRSLNNLVDVTNYVMTEIGHPTHVFDYDKLLNLANKQTPLLKFRLSQKGEKLITLDKKEYSLPGGDIVIVNQKNVIVDLPGIMGAYNSAVDDHTKRIIFFIDNNDAKLMRKTSMTTGIRTVAVTLNEKKVDPQLGKLALYRGIQLYKKIAKAKVVSKIYDIYDHRLPNKQLKTDHNFIQSRLGIDLKNSFVKQTLRNLGFKVTSKDIYKTAKKEIINQDYEIQVPSWRTHDIDIPEDIVEEIARIYGYHNMPNNLPLQQMPAPTKYQAQFYWENFTKQAFKYWGFYETYSYSLVSKNLQKNSNKTALKLKNPLSQDWLYLRTELIFSLLQIIAQNQDKQEKLSFFEMANVYLPRKNDLPKEELHLAAIINHDDFYILKGYLESLAEQMSVKLTFKTKECKQIFKNGVCAVININKQEIGYIGEIKSQLQEGLQIKNSLWAFELDFNKLANVASKNKTYAPIPKYPAIIERLTFFNPDQVEFNNIYQQASKTNKLIKSVVLADRYQDKLSLEITYLDPEKNLSDQDIAPIRKMLVENIEKLGLKLQGEI